MDTPVNLLSRDQDAKGGEEVRTRHALLHMLEDLQRSHDATCESEEKFRAIFDHTLDGIIVMDVDSRSIKFANASMERMLGYGQGELTGMSLSQLHPQDALAAVGAQFGRASQGGLNRVQDMPMLKKDGQIIHVDVTGDMVEIGGQRCLLGSMRDATERRAREKKLLTQLEELQHWQELNLDREDRVLALKQEINDMLTQSGQPPRYPSAQ